VDVVDGGVGGEEVGNGEGDGVAVVDAGDEVGAVLGHCYRVEGEVFVFEGGFERGVDCTVVLGLGVHDHADLLAVFRGIGVVLEPLTFRPLHWTRR